VVRKSGFLLFSFKIIKISPISRAKLAHCFHSRFFVHFFCDLANSPAFQPEKIHVEFQTRKVCRLLTYFDNSNTCWLLSSMSVQFYCCTMLEQRASFMSLGASLQDDNNQHVFEVSKDVKSLHTSLFGIPHEFFRVGTQVNLLSRKKNVRKPAMETIG